MWNKYLPLDLIGTRDRKDGNLKYSGLHVRFIPNCVLRPMFEMFPQGKEEKNTINSLRRNHTIHFHYLYEFVGDTTSQGFRPRPIVAIATRIAQIQR